MQKIVFAILSLFIHTVVAAQSLTVEQYIETYKDIAIREMKRMGIPASITLAQGILETENGNSDLVKKSNNHFGIKCKSTWSGNSVFHDDDEQGECFRKYNTAAESFRDHSNFLRGNDRYAFLFKLAPTDYKGWAYGLKKAGYATNPQYPNILIKNIEQYNLQQYSAEAAGEVPLFDTGKYTDDKNQPETIGIAPAINDPSRGSEMTVSAVKSGKTRFNGLKAVFATKETSLLAIATEHEIALSKLLEFNDLKTDGLLKADSWIFLEKKLKQGNRDFYTTQNDENVYDIAQVNAVQLSNLLAYNSLEEGELVKAGTKILLRPVESKGEKELVMNEKMHEVQPKEGLYAISKKYHVSIEDLKAWNNLASDDLRVGQKLIISK
jgi:LysM repeat protein